MQDMEAQQWVKQRALGQVNAAQTELRRSQCEVAALTAAQDSAVRTDPLDEAGCEWPMVQRQQMEGMAAEKTTLEETNGLCIRCRCCSSLSTGGWVQRIC